MQDPASAPAIITRFAPSPTGFLHLGHLYAADYARQLARQHPAGTFLLRFEDIDTTRVREAFYEAIEDDLKRLGFDWPRPALRQTERLEAYAAALEQLKALGVAYPCFCTRKDIQRELDHLTRAPHGPDGPLYPGTCRKLSSTEVELRLARGETPSWRLDAHAASSMAGELSFDDASLGRQAVDATRLGDVILARKDIGTSYHIAVVVDDAYQHVTDVSRGLDLLESTHVHRCLQALLGLPEPRYHHHSLVTDDEGQRLAKRHAALSLRELLAQGHSRKAILGMANDPRRLKSS